ncbi:hypothetical protein NW762_008324 [Fusarium torreyae]|uniref:WSC domain-containing protein n=1 Tax=Fusarium torreyae TaxID=1237075 RepID=A0A9W8RW41_9HYPO|nr:hypothetical protein NW762_008324 [Fusarium torreyae]
MAYKALTLFYLSTLVAGERALQAPTEEPILNQVTSQGCWSSLPVDGVEADAAGTFVSPGSCGNVCKKKRSPVAILHLAKCYCADTYPPKGALVKDDKCDWPCPGYPYEACGGKDAYSVLNLGLELAPGNADESSANSSESSSTLSDSTSTTSVISESTIATTAASTVSTAHPEEASAAHSEGPSTVADSKNDSTPASTPGPSSSTIPNNASGRLTSPVGNLVRVLRKLR